MTVFEFVFSLFGLLLGLSLAEVLGGFGKAVKARESVRIGWLTPLLGLLLMLDLTFYWFTAWAMRESFPGNSLTLLLLLAFTSLYYLAATLVFPEMPDLQPDFDTHYWRNKRIVLGVVFSLNSVFFVVDWFDERIFMGSSFDLALTGVFWVLLALTWWSRHKRTNLALLAMTIAVYPIGAITGALN